MEDIRDKRTDTGQFVGSAVVAGATYGPQTTLLQLQTFTGDRIDYTLYDIPDPAGLAAFRGNNRRPIAVRIENGGEQCDVVTLTAVGPLRSNITLNTALALQQSGVYTVVYGGLQRGLPCSTTQR